MTDTILEKVRKLLAKAEDPGCTPEEAAALNDKAAELIAKYGVDRALLADREPGSDLVGDRVVVVPAPYALDKSGLLATIAWALRCRTVRRKEWAAGSYTYSMHLFGFGSDLERVEVLFTSLLVQAAYGLAATPVPHFEAPAAFRRSWLAGFTHAVGRRLRQAEFRAAHDSDRDGDTGSGRSVELVLADRTDRVDRRVEEMYPRLRHSGPRRLSGSGIEHGYAAGQRADLNGASVGERRSARASVGGVWRTDG
jgi:hypothetical protein